MRMETKDLKEYLRIVVDLEKNIYLQEQLMCSMRNQISGLGIPGTYTLPIPPTSPKFFSIEDLLNNLANGVGLATIVVIILYVFLRVMYPTSGIAGSLPWPWIWIVISVITFIVYVRETVSAKRKSHQGKREIYEQAYETYQNQLAQDQERLNTEIRQKMVLQASLAKAKERNRATVQLLEEAYSLNVIYGKYRSLPQVCSLYEYIDSGRCSRLEESDGAYNLLEKELLEKTIILRLDQIVQQLGSIQANQYLLYAAIQESNQTLHNIESSINQISEKMERVPPQQEIMYRKLDELQRNSALTAYNTERIERELSYMNRMNYFAGKYDDAGMFRKMPPM